MFNGSRLKIERAKKHIVELHNEIASFLKSDSYLIGVEKHPETGYDTPKLTITKSSPEGLAPIIGDAIHNLHSALDLAVCEVVRDKFGSAATDHVKFPFDGESRDQFIKTCKGRKIAEASPAIFSLILSIEPYKGGNDSLCALHDLDILDKHELLIPMIQIRVITGIRAKDNISGRVADLVVLLSPETQWLQTGLSGDIQIESHGETRFIPCFASDSPVFAGRVVLPTLDQFTKMVTDIIDAFEATSR
jgi:hypothetical protein